jgi:hypothetical protein
MANMISNYVERMKAAFIPQVDNQAKMAMDGTVVVRTNTANGKEWLGFKNGEAVAYPEEMLLDVPVYTIAKTIDQVKAGDIVKATSSTYARVEKIEGNQVYSVSFGGNMRKNTPVTDFLTQQKTIRVVVNPFGGFAGDMNNNMMLLAMLDGKEDGKGDLAEVMMLASMMSGQGAQNPFGNIMANPMAMMMFMKGEGSSSKDFLTMMMLQNCGFNMATPVAKAPVAPVAEVKQD